MPDEVKLVERVIEALTPSAETKAAYMGEFSFAVELAHPRLGSVSRSIDVPWTTIKEIMAAIRARAAIEATRPTAEVKLPCDVRIPPNTLIEAGCKLDTLLTAMSLSGRPKHFVDKATRPTAATDDVVKELVEALEFYAKQWDQDVDAERTAHGWTGSLGEVRPTEELCSDLGQRARTALARTGVTLNG